MKGDRPDAGVAMRTLLTVLLGLLALTAVFSGVAAVGFFGLQRLHSDDAAPAAPPAVEGTVGGQLPGGAAPVAAIPAPPDDAGLAIGAGDAIVAKPPNNPDLAALPPLPKAPIVLSALEAVVRGREIRVELHAGRSHVAGWRDPDASVRWLVGPRHQGNYSVEITFACGDKAGGQFILAWEEQKIEGRARPTGGPHAFQSVTLGTITLPPEGGSLTLHGGEFTGEELMNVREVRLVPARQSTPARRESAPSP